MSDLAIYLAVGWGIWIVLWAWAVRNYHRSMNREETLLMENSQLRSEITHVREAWSRAVRPLSPEGCTLAGSSDAAKFHAC